MLRAQPIGFHGLDALAARRLRTHKGKRGIFATGTRIGRNLGEPQRRIRFARIHQPQRRSNVCVDPSRAILRAHGAYKSVLRFRRKQIARERLLHLLEHGKPCAGVGLVEQKRTAERIEFVHVAFHIARIHHDARAMAHKVGAIFVMLGAEGSAKPAPQRVKVVRGALGRRIGPHNAKQFGPRDFLPAKQHEHGQQRFRTLLREQMGIDRNPANGHFHPSEYIHAHLGNNGRARALHRAIAQRRLYRSEARPSSTAALLGENSRQHIACALAAGRKGHVPAGPHNRRN